MVSVEVRKEKDEPSYNPVLSAMRQYELMYVVAWEALPAEAASFIHAHPTISEAIGETLLASAGRPLH